MVVGSEGLGVSGSPESVKSATEGKGDTNHCGRLVWSIQGQRSGSQVNMVPKVEIFEAGTPGEVR